MRKTICQQLLDASKASRWSQAELIERAGLEIDQPGLSRRLHGHTPLSTAEAEALARALGIRLVAGRRSA